MKRTYVKRRIWHLGGRKKQKAFARPILMSAAGSIGGEVLKGLGKKIFRGRRRRRVKKYRYA